MAEEPEIDFGSFLRQARERRGMSLQQVAATTKISARVLGALEQNDPSKLPGGIFARAFVRAYAREVGLDPEVTVARFIADFPAAAGSDEGPVAVANDDAESFESGRRVAVTVLQLAGVSVLIVIAILIYLNTRTAPPASSAVPEGAGTETAAPATPADGRPQPGGDALPGAPGGGLDGATPSSGPTEASAPAGPAREREASGAPPAGETAPPSRAPLTLGITVTEQCWVSLTADGTEVLSRLLDAGERLTYEARESITLKAGNAGALQLTVNGRRGRPFGGVGRVVTRTITPANIAEFIEQ